MVPIPSCADSYIFMLNTGYRMSKEKIVNNFYINYVGTIDSKNYVGTLDKGQQSTKGNVVRPFGKILQPQNPKSKNENTVRSCQSNLAHVINHLQHLTVTHCTFLVASHNNN